MPSFAFTILVAFCLVFVIEGLLYAFFAEGMKKMMAMALSLPPQQLRVFGLFMALLGVSLIYILKNIAGH